MVDQGPTAVPDADAAMIAALLRLAVQASSKLAVQEELFKIKHDLLAKPEYSIPFEQRIAQIKSLAGLE